MNVLYQFNEKYAPYAGVSVTSLFENNRHMDRIRVFILGEGLSPDSVERLNGTAVRYGREILYIDAQGVIEHLKKIGLSDYRGSQAANLRLFLPWFLDASVERILYLDADTVVCAALDDLWDTDLGECPLAMALDSVINDFRKYRGFDPEENYYNSGVILFDLNRWKQMGYSEKIEDYILHQRASFTSPDQDLLNLVCRGKINTLHPRYNYQPMHVAFSADGFYRHYLRSAYYPRETVAEAKSAPAIYHFFRFLGEFPWHVKNVHPDKALYEEYLARSLWRGFPPLPSEANFFMKVEKLLYLTLPEALFLRIFRLAYGYLSKKTEEAVSRGGYYKTFQG